MIADLAIFKRARAVRRLRREVAHGKVYYQCTDGIFYPECLVSAAVQHELEIMEVEKNGRSKRAEI